jgi:hypothetical protein
VYGGKNHGFSILNEALLNYKGKLLLMVPSFNMLGATKGFATIN